MNTTLKAVTTSLLLASCALGSVANAGVTLLHRYSFNDGTANDSVGKANGKVGGAVHIANGQAHFTGEADQRIELLSSGADGININTLGAVTLETWFTADKIVPWERVFDFGATKGLDDPKAPGANSIAFVLKDLKGSANATFSNSDPSFVGELAAKTDSPPQQQETQVAIVVDAKNLTLYVDGVQAAQESLDDRKLAAISNDYALLGRSVYGVNPAVLIGSINEFRIYKGAATAAEITKSFKAGPDHPAIGASK